MTRPLGPPMAIAHRGLSDARRGGTYLLVAGTLFAASGLLFLVAQAGRFDWRSVRSVSEYWRSSPGVPITWALVNGTAAVASLIAARGVLGVPEHVRRGREPWWRVLSGLALVGYAVIAITNVVDWFSIGRMAQAFAGLDADGQAALERVGSATLDPTLAWRFLTLGPWMALVSGVAWRRGLLMPLAAPLGTVGGTLAVVFSLTSTSWSRAPIVGAAVAVVVHPLWLIATGLTLRQPQDSAGGHASSG